MMRVWSAVTAATTLCHQDKIPLDAGVQAVHESVTDNTAMQN